MNAGDVLALIDATLQDWTVSADAMRWAPERPPPTRSEARASSPVPDHAADALVYALRARPAVAAFSGLRHMIELAAREQERQIREALLPGGFCGEPYPGAAGGWPSSASVPAGPVPAAVMEACGEAAARVRAQQTARRAQ